MSTYNFGCGGGCCNDLNRTSASACNNVASGCSGNNNSNGCGCGCGCNNRPMYCWPYPTPTPPTPTPPITGYAQVYNLTEQAVAAGTDVTFSNNGGNSGLITHTPGTAPVTLTTAGTYLVTARAVTEAPARLGVYLNGAAVPGGTFSTGTIGTTGGTTTIITAPAGAVLTLRNVGADEVTLSGADSTTPTTDTTNAELVIQRLA